MDQRGLVERARRGDHDAFTALVDLTLVRLDSVARLIVRDPELARDAVQDTFIRAWRDLPGLRDPDRFDAWLHRLIVHACLDLVRRRRRRVIEVELTPIDMPAATDMAGEVADRDMLETALARLDAEHRAVVVLHYFLGMPLPEVAAAVGIPLGTAKSRLHYALAAMRRPSSPRPNPDQRRRSRRTSGMTSERRFDQDLPDLLAQVAQAPAPDYRDLIVQRTARTRQRPAWTFPERWLPMSAVTSRAAAAPRFPLRIVGVVALLLIALVVGAVLLAGSQHHLPAPFGLASDGRVAYAAGGDIYTADPVTGIKTAIVSGPDIDVQPIWSRDGTRVVFERESSSPAGESRLYVARADGTGLVAITPDITLKQETDPSRYAFSPDGTEVVYTTGPDTASGELWIAKTDGSGARQIDVHMSVLEAAYRPPNGAEVIVVAANAVGAGIYAVDVATDKVRTIVAPSSGIGLGLVKVSPDGSRIAYSASTDAVPDHNTYNVQVTTIDEFPDRDPADARRGDIPGRPGLVERRHQDRRHARVRGTQRGNDLGGAAVQRIWGCRRGDGTRADRMLRHGHRVGTR